MNSSTSATRGRVEASTSNTTYRPGKSETRPNQARLPSHSGATTVRQPAVRSREVAGPTPILPRSRPRSRADSYTSTASSGRDREPEACLADSHPGSAATSSHDDFYPQRTKAGPLRPGLSQPETLLPTNNAVQRRAVGARRVLRPEQVQTEVEQPSHAKGPIRPPLTSIPDDPPPTTVPQTKETAPSSGPSNEPTREKTLSGPSHKRPAKQLPQPPTPKLRAQPKFDKSNDRSQKNSGSRLTKPTASQLARQNSAATTSQHRAGAPTKVGEWPPVKAPKASKRGETQLTSLKKLPIKDPHHTDTVSVSVSREPINIPLPPSPAEAPPLQEDKTPTETILAIEDKDQTPRHPPPLQPQFIIDPTTPIAATKPLPMLAVEQTPITALVDSIRDGFLFTPRPGVDDDEDDYDEEADNTFRMDTLEPLHIPPLNWTRKTSSVS